MPVDPETRGRALGSPGSRPQRRPDVFAQPFDERAGGLEPGADALSACRLVQPGAELLAAEDGQLLHPQSLDPRVIDRIALWSALELGRSGLEPAALRSANGALEPAREPVVVDRGAEALELVRGRVVDAGRHQQAVERQVEVVAATAAVADRDREVLLQRWTGPEAQVVVGPEEVRLAEMAERRRDPPAGPQEIAVVALAVGAEPVAVVVRLELSPEFERRRRPHRPIEI